MANSGDSFWREIKKWTLKGKKKLISWMEEKNAQKQWKKVMKTEMVHKRTFFPTYNII